MLSENDEAAVDLAWRLLRPGNCFFVRCIDPIRAEKNIRARGYVHGKKPALTEIGILDGFIGVLCYRRGDLYISKKRRS